MTSTLTREFAVAILALLQLVSVGAEDDPSGSGNDIVVIGGYGISGMFTPQEDRFWTGLAATNAKARFSQLVGHTSTVSRAYASIALSLLDPMSASNAVRTLRADTNSVILVRQDFRSLETVGSITELALRGGFVVHLLKHEECQHLLSRHIPRETNSNGATSEGK